MRFPLYWSFSMFGPAQAIAASLLLAGSSQTLAEPAGATVLETVVVTARRREETLQTVPVSVSAFSGEVIDDIGADELQDLSQLVPNAKIDNLAGWQQSARVFIRGIGSNEIETTFEPAVGIYVDGIYQGRNQGTNLDFFNLAGIEVLRGPQGTLFGRNTTGGAISVSTRQPEFDSRSYRLDLRTGNYDRRDLRAAVNLPVSDNLALNAAVLVKQRDGFFFNTFTDEDIGGEDTLGFRANLAWRADDHTELVLGVDAARTDTTFGTGQNVLDGDDGTPFLGPGSPLRAFPSDNEFDVASEFPNINDIDSYGARLNFRTRAFGQNVEFIGGYRTFEEFFSVDFDATEVQQFGVVRDEDYSQWSGELKFTPIDPGRLDYTAGAIVFYNEMEAGQETFIGVVPAPALPGGVAFTPEALAVRESEYSALSAAVYAEPSYQVNDRLRLFAGLRYNFDEKHYGQTNTVAGRSVVLFSVDDDDNSETYTALSWRLGADYFVSEQTMLYGLYARGFKSGSFNGRSESLAAATTPYDEEIVDSFEVGSKSEFLDNRLRLNLAAYYAIYQDLQVIASIPDTPAETTILNAGESTAWGFEVESQALITPSLSANLTIGYTNVEFDDVPEGLPPGAEPTHTPEYEVGASLAYASELAGIGNINARLQVSQTGPFWHDSNNLFEQESYVLVDANLKWTDLSGRFYVNLIANNLFDERYYEGALPLGFISPFYAGPPRTYQIAVGLNF